MPMHGETVKSLAPLCTLAALSCTIAATSPVHAQETPPLETEGPTLYEIGQTVKALAFDGRRFFESEGGSRPFLTAYYGGDDYDYPVYAFALKYDWICQGPQSGRTCATRIAARMVRAAELPNEQRPRWAATALLGELRRRGAFSRASIAEHLSDAGAQWLEADVSSCPTARHLILPRLLADWFPFEITDARPALLPMHADTVTVEYSWNGATARYSGPVAEGSPAEWANQLVSALEPCWKAAEATAPWKVAR